MKNISLLIIDSLQNLVPEDKATASECLRTLKETALKLRLPIIITSSINMKKYPRNKNPIAADPNYSVITKYSDVVLILRKGECETSLPSIKESPSCRYQNALIAKMKIEITIAQKTNGLTGTLFLDYMPQHGGFEDMDERPDSAPVEWSDAY